MLGILVDLVVLLEWIVEIGMSFILDRLRESLKDLGANDGLVIDEIFPIGVG